MRDYEYQYREHSPIVGSILYSTNAPGHEAQNDGEYTDENRNNISGQ